MNMPVDYELSQRLLNERLREAENERLARLAQANGQKANPAYAPLLAKLGRQLVNLGEHLQEQYEAAGSLVTES